MEKWLEFCETFIEYVFLMMLFGINFVNNIGTKEPKRTSYSMLNYHFMGANKVQIKCTFCLGLIVLYLNILFSVSLSMHEIK